MLSSLSLPSPLFFHLETVDDKLNTTFVKSKMAINKIHKEAYNILSTHALRISNKVITLTSYERLCIKLTLLVLSQASGDGMARFLRAKLHGMLVCISRLCECARLSANPPLKISVYNLRKTLESWTMVQTLILYVLQELHIARYFVFPER